MPEILTSYKDIKIMRDEESDLPVYIVLPPKFSDEEANIVKNTKAFATAANYDEVIKKLETFRTVGEKEEFLKQYLKAQLGQKTISPENLDKIISMIMDDIFFGYGRIGTLMRDDNLEEIMINGIEIPVFIVHKKYGMCMTNIQYEDTESINELIGWLSKYTGRKIDETTPLLDAHMPDGSRANVVIPPTAPNGPSITIRKFKRAPYNIIDLIILRSISIDLAAFLWVCVEGFGINPCNILVAGGSGSGKTTLLNALSMLIPPSERIVTVEDTLELNLEFMDNWVALEATPSVIEKMATRLDMDALVENSLRMRPDRVFVGEVRGVEAETLFVAMDIGLNGSMGTIHSNNARETTIRLMEKPMNLPIRMFTLLDLIVVVNRYYDKKRGVIRRVTEVAEIAGIENDMVQLGNVYEWDMVKDLISRTEYPIILKEKIAEKCKLTKRELDKEIYVREKVIEYMVRNNIRDNKKVIDILRKYHKDPKSVISMIQSKKLA